MQKRLNAIPSTPRSLYHFQNGVILSAISMVMWCLIYVVTMENESINDGFIVMFVIQILFASIMSINGIFTIRSVS